MRNKMCDLVLLSYCVSIVKKKKNAHAFGFYTMLASSYNYYVYIYLASLPKCLSCFPDLSDIYHFHPL